MAKILVTGSKGVVGTQLVEELLKRGHKVIGLDLHHGLGEVGWEHPMGSTEFDYTRCDVGDYRQISRVFEKYGPFQFVYHAAAEFGRWNGEDFYEQVWKSNAIGTKNVIRLQERYGFKLIHFSSSEVYGDFDGLMKESVMDEIEIKQMNDYAMTKWVNEMQVANSRIKNGTETVIVRLFNTYGPGEWYHPYRSVNAKFCYHALMGLPITVYKGYERSSTYLLDTINTLGNIVDNFKDGEAYNIGGAQLHSIEELAEIIWDYIGADKSLIKYQDGEILTTKSKKTDVSKSERDLKHKNSVSLKEGVQKTIDWMISYYKLDITVGKDIKLESEKKDRINRRRSFT